ncbi:MAG TPA: hypothetical protein VLL27_12075 [Solirubrobacterales bacterium]|nr:hypothetical protein [Solirubrobacterales bacterium]
MPVSIVAVAILLTLFVPGYLFQSAVREYSSILAADRDIFAVAQAVALSGGFIVAGFFVLNLLDAVNVWSAAKIRDELLQSPTTETGLNMAQSLSLLGLLILPILLGRAFGMANARSRAKVPEQASGSRSVPGWVWFGITFPIRLLFRFFFRPSPMETKIRKLTYDEAPVYVRIVRQGQEDAIGLLDAASQEASRSALGRGVALAARWAPGTAGWERLCGCHVSVIDVIDIFEWRPGSGKPAPDWMRHIPT